MTNINFGSQFKAFAATCLLLLACLCTFVHVPSALATTAYTFLFEFLGRAGFVCLVGQMLFFYETKSEKNNSHSIVLARLPPRLAFL